MDITVAERPPRARLRLLIHVAFAIVGVAALGVMIHQVGPATLGSMLSAAMVWLPILLCLEIARIAGDTGSTYFLYRRWGAGLPLGELLRAQLVAYPISILAPASRATAEAVKAQSLARLSTGPRAAAVATMNQSLALYGGALVTVPCLVASFAMTGASLLSLALGLQLALSTAVGLGLQVAVRRKAIGGWLSRRFARAGKVTEQYQEALLDHSIVPTRPLACALVNRTAQVLQFAVLVLAVTGSTSLGKGLLAQGISMVGTSVGDLVPGQIGVTDGAFALSAAALGITAANGIAISVIAHFVQMCWVLVGCLVPLVWKPLAARMPTLVIAASPTPTREDVEEYEDLARATPR